MYNTNTILEILDELEETQLNENIIQSMVNSRERNLITIDTENISAIDFALSDDNKKLLLKNGYESTLHFFNKLTQSDISEKIETPKTQESFLYRMFSYVYKLFY